MPDEPLFTAPIEWDEDVLKLEFERYAAGLTRWFRLGSIVINRAEPESDEPFVVEGE